MFGGRMVSFLLGGIVVSVCSFGFSTSNISIGAEYTGNAGCKCHMSKGCFEGEEYKERLHSHTFKERLKTDEEKSNPECLKCHATALDMKIKKDKSKLGNFIEDVACEACHGP